jgi:hypothetical protein
MRKKKVFVKMSEINPIQPPDKDKPIQPLTPPKKPKKVYPPAQKTQTFGSMFKFLGKDEKQAIQQVFRLASSTILFTMQKQLENQKRLDREENE